MKFLLAGGIAGVISRTATAPFDRLKVYLITASPDTAAPLKETVAAVKNGSVGAGVGAAAGAASQGTKAITDAIASLYRGGGVRAFWVGNGLNSAKILPVS